MAGYDYTLRLNVNEKDIESQLTNAFNNVRKAQENNTVIIKFNADKSQLEEELKKIQMSGKDITKIIHLEFDETEFQNKLGTLKTLAKNTANDFGKSFTKEMTKVRQEMAKSIDLSELVKSNLKGKNNVTPDNIKNVVSKLKDNLGTFDFTGDVDFDKLYKYREELEHIIDIVEGYNQNHSSKKINLSELDNLRENFYKNANDYISKMDIDGLIKSVTDDWGNALTTVRTQILSIFDGVGVSGESGLQKEIDAVTDTITSLKNELDKVIKKRNELQEKKDKNIITTDDLSNMRTKVKESYTAETLKYDSELAGQYLSMEADYYNSIKGKVAKAEYEKSAYHNFAKELTGFLKKPYELVEQKNLDEAVDRIKVIENALERSREHLATLKGKAEDGNGSGNGDGTGSGEQKDKAKVPVEPEVDGKEFVKQVQEIVNQSGEKVTVDVESKFNSTNDADKGITDFTKDVEEWLEEKPVSIKVKPSVDVESFISDIQSELNNSSSKVKVDVQQNIKEDIENVAKEIENDNSRKINLGISPNVDAENFISDVQETISNSNKKIHIDVEPTVSETFISSIQDDIKEQKVNVTVNSVPEDDSSTRTKEEPIKNPLIDRKDVTKARIKELNAELDSQNNLLKEAEKNIEKYKDILADIPSILTDVIAKTKEFNLNPYDEAVKKLEEGKSVNKAQMQDKLDKAAAYYGLYRESGGTDPILNSKNEDVSERLLGYYQSMKNALKECGDMQQKEVIALLNNQGEIANSTRERIENIKTEIKYHKENLATINKQIKAQEKLNNATPVAEKVKSTSTASASKSKSKTATTSTTSNSIDIEAAFANAFAELEQEEKAKAKDNVIVPVTPKIDPKEFVADIQTELNKAGSKVDVEVAPAVPTDFVTQVQEELKGKTVELNIKPGNLEEIVDEIKDSVNAKIGNNTTSTTKSKSNTSTASNVNYDELVHFNSNEWDTVYEKFKDKESEIGKILKIQKSIRRTEEGFAESYKLIGENASLIVGMDSANQGVLSGTGSHITDVGKELEEQKKIEKEVAAYEAQVEKEKLDAEKRLQKEQEKRYSQEKQQEEWWAKALHEREQKENALIVQKDIDKEASEIKNVTSAYEHLTKTEKDYQILREKENSSERLTSSEAAKLADLTLSRKKDLEVITDTIRANKELAKSQNVLDADSAYKQRKSEMPTILSAYKTGNAKEIPDSFVTDIDKAREEALAVNNALAKTKSIMDSISTSTDAGNIDSVMERAQEEVNSLNKKLTEGSISIRNYEDKINRLGSELSKVIGVADTPSEAIGQAMDYVNKLSNGTAEIKSLDMVTGKLTATFVDEEKKLRTVSFALDENAKQVKKVSDTSRKATSTVQKFFNELKGKFGDVTKYLLSFGGFYEVVNIIRTLTTNTIELNTQMTELKKVSDATADRLNESFKNSAQSAKELGATISDTISATSDWSRMGYGIDQAEELAEVAILYKNVGDGIDIDSANESLISTLQGFQMEADSAMEIVDKFNEVSNNFAISSAGIGESLQRSAASFSASGTDLSKSIALITATNEVLQDPTSVGTLWKTLSARIRGAETELSELNEEMDEYTESSSKLQDLVMGLTGFDIMEDEDTFKDIYEIILGIGQEWDNLTDVEQANNNCLYVQKCA